jgi:hypothetical protein
VGDARVRRDALIARYPTRYQSMPLTKAMLELHRTSRVYGDSTTLVDPSTGHSWPTLGPAPALAP